MIKRSFTILIILLFITVIPANADKIQIKESWTYLDSNNNSYDEISNDTIQLKTLSDNFMAVSAIETQRPIPRMPIGLSINETFEGVEFFIEIGFNGTSNEAYLTQEGGFPLYTNENLTGQISAIITDKQNTTRNKEYIRNFNDIISVGIDGKPSRAITTGDTEIFTYSGKIDLSRDNILDNQLLFFVDKEYVLSTDQPITQNIRNYTPTPYYTRIYYFVEPNLPEGFLELELISTTTTTTINIIYSDYILGYEVHGNIIKNQPNISLHGYNDDAMLFTFDSAKKLPTYIKQTQPAKIKHGLTLSRINEETVEYFLEEEKITSMPISIISVPITITRITSLISEKTITSEKTIIKESMFPILAIFVTIPILTLIKRRKNILK